MTASVIALLCIGAIFILAVGIFIGLWIAFTYEAERKANSDDHEMIEARWP